MATASVASSDHTPVILFVVIGGFNFAVYFGWIIYHLVAGTKLGAVPPPAKPIPAPTPLLVLRGMAMVNGIGQRRGPWATLTLDRDQAELMCPGADLVRISRAEVTGLRWTPAGAGRKVRFETESGRLDKVTFWPWLGFRFQSHGPSARYQMHELGWS